MYFGICFDFFLDFLDKKKISLTLMGQNSIISSLFAQRAIKHLAEGQSPPQ